MSFERLFERIEANAARVIGGVLLLTALLAVPMVAMAPEDQASPDPDGPVFDAFEAINDVLVSPIFAPFYIVEAPDGDMLTREPLLELLENEAAMRNDPELAEKLYSYESANYGTAVTGVYTLADAIDKDLRENGVAEGIAGASDEQIKVAADRVLDPAAGTEDLGDGLSVQTTSEERVVGGETITWRVVPAFTFVVLADNDALGGGGFAANIGGDDATLDKEQYSRDLEEALRGNEAAIEVGGVGIDVNLTSEDEGAKAGPFIALTIIAILVVVGVVLRSYWAVALTGASLAVLIVWLKGITNLVGLDESLMLSLIVPIAMISFGVDFAFHAVGRVREESAEHGGRRGHAYRLGLPAVGGALLLATLTDSLAFLSNVTSGIPQVIEFGIGAAIALTSAFLILGIVMPLALASVEERLVAPKPRRWTTAGKVAAIAVAAGMAGATVLMLIFFPLFGMIGLPIYIGAFLVIPFLRERKLSANRDEAAVVQTHHGSQSALSGAVVRGFARARYVVLPVALMVSGVAAYAALDVKVAFDVKDFFSSDSDFVVHLDVLEEHSAAGESALIYVEGDLAEPEALAAIQRFRESAETSTSGLMGRLANGDLQLLPGALEIVEDALASPVAVGAIGEATGVALTDENGDGIPDTREQVLATYEYARVGGIPGEGGAILAPADIPSRLYEDDDGVFATAMTLGLQGTREQSNIDDARDEMEPWLDDLEDDLAAIGGGEATAQLTGSPIIRHEGLLATVDALLFSLPVAVLLCLVVAAIFMRSIRFAVAATVPILLVVAWLYAIMAIFDFDLNVVTATIGAISVGVGVDFGIHFTMRYREELERQGSRIEALGTAGAGTGMAIFASAASSMVGFFVLSFAPMPMFATYGLLTAIMIALAAVATLAVLPPLLMTITRDGVPAIQDREGAAATR